MSKVWSVGIFTEDKNYQVQSPLSHLVKVFDARKARLTKKHVHTYADPFLFVHENFLYLFIEVQEIGGKGYINTWRTNNLQEWSDLGCILRKKIHLSYPFVFQDERTGKIYLLPESSEERKIILYEFESFPGKLVPRNIIMDGNFADSNLVYHEGTYYLSSLDQDINQNRLFYSDLLYGPWQEHPSSPVTTRYPRNGGGFFKIGNQLYRVAQNTSIRYGGGIVIFEISSLSKATYTEDIIINDFKTATDHSWQKKGRHHFSIVNFNDHKIIAIDGQQKDYLLNKLVNAVFKFLR
jgi:hypothetical protein